MAVREGQGPSTTRNAQHDFPPAEVIIRSSRKAKSKNEACDDLMRFMDAMWKHPKEADTYDQICREIDEVLDDDLITGLDILLKHFFFSHTGREITQEMSDAVFMPHRLAELLRALQHTRLRDSVRIILGNN